MQKTNVELIKPILKLLTISCVVSFVVQPTAKNNWYNLSQGKLFSSKPTIIQ